MELVVMDTTRDERVLRCLTLCQESLVWVGGEPGLAVGWFIQLLNEFKLARHLSVVVNCQRLRAVLHELHIFELELRERQASRNQRGKHDLQTD